MELNKIYNGKMEVVLPTFEANIFDSIVTDPPYGLNFMGKRWDYSIPTVEEWIEAYRVLKPGGHLLCACGTRTQHRMAVNIEDAGFEIRDVITWHYGSGFPKSLNIAMAIDKQKGVIGHRGKAFVTAGAGEREDIQGTIGGQEMAYNNPITDEAKEWNGWGTALKPATEFWTLARKPLSENTVAENVLKYGTGEINIDGSRIATDDVLSIGSNNRENGNINFGMKDNKEAQTQNELGRFPANLILDEFMGAELDKQSGFSKSTSNIGNPIKPSDSIGTFKTKERNRVPAPDDEGGASRFFYCPKPDDFQRNKGLKGFDEKLQANATFRPNHLEKALEGDSGKPHGRYSPKKNNHPTVKPIDLMRYLVKLITPKKGICLDPYCGSGTTLIGCKLELINYIGIEMEAEYCKIAEARVAAWNPDKYKPQTLF